MLLDSLVKRPEDDFYKFIGILSATGNEHLAQKLSPNRQTFEETVQSTMSCQADADQLDPNTD
jgi:hypothetical protein